MTQQLQPVKVSEIVMNAGTQMRSWMNTEAISEYAALMKEGVEFDPIEVYLVDDKLILVNGFHRVNAAIKAQLESISALITVGTLEEALWASIAANKKNALKRNSSDIQKAIEAALLHPQGAALSDRQIAEHVGCSHPTVGSVRAKLVATGKLSSGEERIGKDGRTINTTKIGLKNQIEHWHALIFNTWLKELNTQADLILIHQGGEYLHILLEVYGKNEPIIKKKYHLDYSYFSPRGGNQSGHAIRFDRAYVDLFEEDGLKIYIAEFKDLPKGMQKVAKAAWNDKYYNGSKLHTLTRVDPELKPGDRIASINRDYSIMFSIVGVSKSFVHGRKFGSDQDHILFGSQIVPVKGVKFTESPYLLNRQQWNEGEMGWPKEYAGLKEFYAQDAILFANSNDAYIALGEDAMQASAYVPGISANDEQLGAVFITFDESAIQRYAKDVSVIVYSSGRPTVRNFWQNIVAAQAHPAAQPPASALEDLSTLDELAIDEQLAEQVITDHPGIPSQVYPDSSKVDQAEQSLYVMLGNFGFDEIEPLAPALQGILLFIHGLHKADESILQGVTTWRDFLSRVEATVFEAERAS